MILRGDFLVTTWGNLGILDLGEQSAVLHASVMPFWTFHLKHLRQSLFLTRTRSSNQTLIMILMCLSEAGASTTGLPCRGRPHRAAHQGASLRMLQMWMQLEIYQTQLNT